MVSKKASKHLKNSLPIILGVIVGYVLTLCVFSELIPILIGTQGLVYPLVLYSTLSSSILSFILFFQIVIAKKISKLIFYCWMLPYFIILVCVLFCRHSYESFFIINPFIGLMEMASDWEMLLQSVLNILMFIPIGYFLREKRTRTALIISVILALIIEMIQYVFKLGFFDTFDCLLYIVGICLGKYMALRITERVNR